MCYDLPFWFGTSFAPATYSLTESSLIYVSHDPKNH